MKDIENVMGMIVCVLVLAGGVAVGGESYWGSSTGNFSDSGSWESGGVPGDTDNAHFTNNATYTVTWTADADNASAFFDAPGDGTVTLDASTYTWALSDVLHVGDDPNAAVSVELAGGTATVDRVMLTNVVAGDGSSWFNVNGGTLNTSGDSQIRVATNGHGGGVYRDLRVGKTDGSGTAVWNITGGTTTVSIVSAGGEPHPAFLIGGYGLSTRSGIVNVSGAGTVLSNDASGGRLLVGAGHSWGGANLAGSRNNELNISGGAKVYSEHSVSVLSWISRENRMMIDGDGSLFSGYSIAQCKGGAVDTTLVVTNGGTLRLATQWSIGEGAGAQCSGSMLRVSGTNSLAELGTRLYLMGRNGTVLVDNGGTLTVGTGIDMNWQNKAGNDNRIIVSGHGTSMTNLGNASATLTTRFNTGLQYSNATMRIEDGASYVGNGSLYVGGTRDSISTNMFGCTFEALDAGTYASFLYDVRLSKYEVDPTWNLLVSNDASVVCRHGYIGSDASPVFINNTPATAGGAALVTGSDSVWTNTGNMYVGSATNGVLAIRDGGRVATEGSGYIGYAAGSTASVALTGGGCVWTNTGNLTVGRSDDGSTATLAFEVDETGCGTVYVDGTLTIYPAQSYLTVDLSNYLWEQGTEFVLVDCGALSTAFNEDQIHVTGLNGGSVSQDADNNNQIILTVKGPVGTTIAVK